MKKALAVLLAAVMCCTLLSACGQPETTDPTEGTEGTQTETNAADLVYAVEAGSAGEAIAKEKGARRCLPLKVSGPFHTRLMAPAGDALAERFKTERFREMQIPVLFNCLGREKADADTIPALLVRQVQSSVYMEDTLRRLGELGVDHILEVGPGSALSGFVKKTLPGVPCASVETPEQLDAALAAWRDEA